MLSKQDWQQEELYFTRVKEYIEEQLEQFRKKVSDRGEQAVEIRKHFWDEISVNVDNYDEMVETLASIRQQELVLRSHMHGLSHAEKQLRKLENMEREPYFGRIDFIENGEQDVERIYIGIGSLMNDDTGEAFVYDWRAPIAGLFYDHSLGPASYETPSGTIEGELKRKRQYVIEGGKLHSVFDTGLHIGDEMLQKMLNRHADERMKHIVSTIQQEQNLVIRDETHRVLVVQGAAGSGKTSAALQRIAYLLYRYRKNMDADQVLLFTPNDIFQDYVSAVLPELGEQNVPQTTFYDWVCHRVGDELEVEHPYDYLEAQLCEQYDENAPASAHKMSATQGHVQPSSAENTMQELESLIQQLEQGGIVFRPLMYGKRVLVSSEQMAKQYYEVYEDASLRARMAQMEKWLIEDVIKPYRKEIVEKMYRKLLKEPGYIGTKEELKTIAKRKAKKRYVKLLRHVKRRAFIDRIATYTSFVRDEHVIDKMKRGILPYTETARYVYFLDHLEGLGTYNRIKHVLIDEVQDYSIEQLAVIQRLFPRSRFTFLGDLNQSIMQSDGLNHYSGLEHVFGREELGIIHLTKSYRSTQEILQFCQKILPDGEESEAYVRNGEAPQLTRHNTEGEMNVAIAERIAQLKEEGHPSIAIICRTERDAIRAHAGITDAMKQIELGLITRESHHFESAVTVIPSYMAKGLEFDAVIAYDTSASTYQEGDRKLLYTVCTRALHRLYLEYVDTPSVLLPR